MNQTDLSAAVDAKSAAVSAHIDLAAGDNTTGQLVWTFASASSGISVFPEARLAARWKSECSDLLRFQGMAVGNGTAPGVNNKTITYLASKKGSRFGAILYDFYGSDARLGPATLGWDLSTVSNRCAPLFVMPRVDLRRRLVPHQPPRNMEEP